MMKNARRHKVLFLLVSTELSKESGSASVVAVKVESVSGFDVLVSSLSFVIKFASQYELEAFRIQFMMSNLLQSQVRWSYKSTTMLNMPTG
jgi:hypothetical protein